VAVCIKEVNWIWKWSTDNTQLHIPNKFSSPTSTQHAYPFKELKNASDKNIQ
jgi:hypothetical protein